jgi:general stress protein 26
MRNEANGASGDEGQIKRLLDFAWPLKGRMPKDMTSKVPARQDAIVELWKHIEQAPSVMLDADDENLPMESVLAYADRINVLIWIFCKQKSPVFQATKSQSKLAHISVISNDQMFRALLKGMLRERSEPADSRPFWNHALAGWYLSNHDDPELPVMCFKPKSATITVGQENYMNFGWDLFGTTGTKRRLDNGYHMEIDF